MSLCCACAEDGAVMQVVQAVGFDPVTCLPGAAATATMTRGKYDPKAPFDLKQAEHPAFHVGIVVQNNLLPLAAGASGGPNVNQAHLLGFDYCVANLDELATFDGFSDGLPFQCEDLPEDQRGFVALSALIEEGAFLTVETPVPLADRLAAKGLYGAGFDPKAIAEEGAVTVGSKTLYSYLSKYPTTPGVTGWGKFPKKERRTAEVMLLFHAVAKRQTGIPIESNWLPLPVELCVGCFAARCGQPECEDPACTALKVAPKVDPVAPCLPFQDIKATCTAR